MTGVSLSALHESRRTRIASCIASLFALSAPTVLPAATVTSCEDDNSAGTLRFVIAAAAEGETVDFAGLTCVSSKITLSGASIAIAQKSLTIDGSGALSKLTIDASALSRSGPVNSRVFSHYTGGGTLAIKGLDLYGGFVLHYGYSPVGGCILSQGDVSLDTVTVDHCATSAPAGASAEGGAIHVFGDLTLTNSNVTYGSATGGGGRGGGVYVHGNLHAHDSSISHNSAMGTNDVRGGGAYVHADMTIDGSSSMSYNGATADSGDGLGGGAFVLGDVTLSEASGKYNVFNRNSASSASGAAKGGAVFAFGSLTAGTHSEVLYNSASSTTGIAVGGGLYAGGALDLQVSNIVFNTATGAKSYGAGAFSAGGSTISNTGVKYNRAYGTGAQGGGLLLLGATNTITASTISNNTSDSEFGGVAAFGQGSGVSFELKNSTISGNQALSQFGGIFVDSASVQLFNSTIAFNTAGGAFPGVVLSAAANPMAANLQSTVISNNSVGSDQLDLSTLPSASSVTFNGGAPATAANNLVRATLVTNLPTDTQQGFCPHLGPLRDNGGLTRTHALMSNSPAIDAGNDSALGALFDQRGSAAVNGTLDYTRFSGPGAIADIGAYELQQNDILFTTDFEDCPALAF